MMILMRYYNKTYGSFTQHEITVPGSKNNFNTIIKVTEKLNASLFKLNFLFELMSGLII